MRRLSGAAAGRHAAAPGHRRRHGQRRGRRRARRALRRRRMRSRRSTSSRPTSRRTPSSSPARTRSRTRSPTGSPSPRRTCCPATGDRARRSTSCSPTCRTSAPTRSPGCRVATSFEPALALDGGADGLEVIGRLLDQLPGRRWPTTASRCSRSAATRATPSSSSSRSGCRAGRARSSRPRRAAAGRADRRAGRRGPRDAVVGGRSAPADSGDVRASSGRPTRSCPSARRARHRRHARRRRPVDRAATRERRSARPARRGRHRHARSPAGWSRAPLRFARELELDAPIVGYQGALIREMPARRVDAARAAARPHARSSADVARDVVAWTRCAGPRPAPQPPRAVHRPRRRPAGRRLQRPSWARARSSRTTSVASIRHPVTKVMAVGEPPAARPRSPPRPAPRSPAGPTSTVSHPRFLEFVAPGVSKGRAVRWLARRLGRPARGGPRHRRPVERPRDAGRGRARDGDADAPRPRSRRSPATSRRRSPRRASPGSSRRSSSAAARRPRAPPGARLTPTAGARPPTPMHGRVEAVPA